MSAVNLLQNGYPDNPVLYVVSISFYVCTAVLTIITLIAFCKYKSGGTSINFTSRSLWLFVASCIFSFIRTVAWCVANIALLTLSRTPYAIQAWPLVFEITSTIGYIAQFVYQLFIGYFIANTLFEQFDKTSHAVKKKVVIIPFLIYTISALSFNAFYAISDAYDDTKFDPLERWASWTWMFVCVAYNLQISSMFIFKLIKYAKMDSASPTYQETFTVSKPIVNKTLSIVLISICMALYIIGTFMCFHLQRRVNIHHLHTWHALYMVSQSLALYGAYLSLKRDGYQCCYSCWQWVLKRATPQRRMYQSIQQNASNENVELAPFDACSKDLDQCERVKVICYLLRQFTSSNDYHMDEISKYLESHKYQVKHLLNDYYHCLLYHDSIEDFNEIYYRLVEENQHPSYNECKVHQRHYARRRRQQDITGRENRRRREPIMCFLDKIHAYYYHSIDTNLRTKLSVQDANPTDDDSAVDGQLFNNDKYNFDAGLDDNVNPENAAVYEFGARFEYELDDHESRIPVQKRYKNLQLELMQNMKEPIDRDTYHEEYGKAESCYKTDFCKKRVMSPYSANGLKLEHILVLLVYTNCDKFQKEWTDSFRRKSQVRASRTSQSSKMRHRVMDDSDDDDGYEEDMKLERDPMYMTTRYGDAELIARHSHFFHCSKYLIELVEGFGTRLLDRHNKPIKKTFHRGLSKIFYPTRTVAQFYEPLSTSDELLVAQRFSGHNGMILAFQYKSSQNPMNAKYFDCKYFSDFTNEKECLFVGGIPVMCISNIINVVTEDEYKEDLEALNIINSLLSGSYQADPDNANNAAVVARCRDLLLAKSSSTDKEIPEYVRSLAEHFRNSLRHVVVFWQQFEDNPSLKPIKALLDHEKVFFFDLDRLLSIFPNIEHIEYYNQSLQSSSMTLLFETSLVERIVLHILRHSTSSLQTVSIYHKVSLNKEYMTKALEESEWKIDETNSDRITLARKRRDSHFTPPVFRLRSVQRGLDTAQMIHKS